VRIYEYKPGFIHAKSYLVDDEYAMIGTINLDYRSLVHHFENGVWMYRCACIADLKTDLEKTLEQCILADEKTAKTSPVMRLVRAIGRIFAPLL
jgi:cardiolipin synthase